MPGSIEKRGPHSWRVIISDGYNADGTKRTIRQTVKFADTMTEAQERKECENIAATLYAKAKAGQVVSSKQYTLQEYAEMWLEDYPQTAGLSDVTVAGYRELLEGRIYPMLGNMKMHQITAQHITRFYNKLLKEPCKKDGKGKTLSASTVLHYHRLLRSMFNIAVKWGIIPNNVVLNATTPKNDSKRMKVYDPKQAATLMEKLNDAPLKHQTGVALGLLRQMRLGEIGGLNWDDVDFDRKTLRVERSAVCITGKGVVIKSTKTEAGRRVISLPEDVMMLLRRLKTEQAQTRLQLGEKWEECNAVFTQWNGRRQHPRTLSSWFQKFLKRNDLPKIRFHDLRHSGASLLLNIMGMPTQIVTDRLGHSSPSVTMNFYSHGYEERDRAAADGLGALLSTANGGK